MRFGSTAEAARSGSLDTYNTSGPNGKTTLMRMPTPNSPNALEALKRQRARITGRSGRASTRLAGNDAYRNVFLGDT